jgi:DNA-binding beta-propeller fold protein YncE
LAVLIVTVGAAVLLTAPAVAQAAPNAAFVTDEGNSSVDQYAFGTNNTLTANGSAAAGSEPWMQAITPNGKYLYAANFSGGTINQYSIGSGGTLTALSPASLTPGANPYGIAVSPDGKNAYVGDGRTDLFVYAIGTDGTLTQIQDVTANLSGASGVAVSPDGLSIYVVNTNHTIAEFDRASTGTLSPKAVPTVASDTGQLGMPVLTPDGTSLYAASADNNLVDQYSVGTGGELTAKSTPSVSAGTNAYFYALTISPDGHSLYAPSYGDGKIYQYDIGTGGALTPKSVPSLVSGSGVDSGVIFVWFTANGKNAYATNYRDGTISQYDVPSSGELSPKSPATASSSGSELLSIMIAPDQGPVAAFTSKAAKVGHATTFNGSGSSDSDGTVVRYDWSFGDGTTLSNGGATPSHTYKKKGTYTVTLTVTDDSGCSTTQVFTGQTAYCNGGPAATVTRRVKIASAIKPLKLAVSPRNTRAGKTTCFTFTATSSAHHVSGVKVRFDGHTAHTKSTGRARLCLVPKKGTYAATATKKGYKNARTTVKVRAAATSPVFTG